MIKVMYGTEPYLIDKEVQKIKEDVSEIDISVFQVINESMKDIIVSLPMLSTKRVVILYMDILKGDELIEVLQMVPESTDFIIIAKEVDKRTKLFTKLKSAKVLQEFNKMAEIDLKKFIYSLLDESQCTMAHTAYAEFVKRSGYYDNDDISLYTIEIYLRQAMFLSSVITLDVLEKIVAPTSNEKIYLLTKHLLKGEIEYSLTLAREFMDRGENAIGILSLMHRLFRLSYKASLYSDKNNQEIGYLLGVPVYQFQDALNMNNVNVAKVMEIISESIDGIKNKRSEADTLLLLAISKIGMIINKGN